MVLSLLLLLFFLVLFMLSLLMLLRRIDDLIFIGVVVESSDRGVAGRRQPNRRRGSNLHKASDGGVFKFLMVNEIPLLLLVMTRQLLLVVILLLGLSVRVMLGLLQLTLTM